MTAGASPEEPGARLEAAEARLGEAEGQFRRIVEQLAAVVFTTEIRGRGRENRSLYVSPQIEDLLGFTQQEVMANPDFWMTLVHPDDRQRVVGAVRASLLRTEPYRVEFRVVRRDGRVLWLLVKGSPHVPPPRPDRERVVTFDGLLFDISEAKAAEAALLAATRQAEARADQLATLNRITQRITSEREIGPMLQAVAREMVDLFDAQNGAIALLSEGGARVVADHSRAADTPSLVGAILPILDTRTESTVVGQGRPITARVGETRSDALHALMKARGAESVMICPLLSRGQVVGAIAIDTPSPERTFSEDELGLAVTVAGQIAGAVENARLFAEEHRSREAAESAARAKSQFLASVSHELRTPLTAILGFVQELSKTPDRGREDRETLDVIRRSGEQLLGLINDVLSITKLETGSLALATTPFDLAGLLTGIAAEFRRRAEAKGLEMALALSELPAVVEGDPEKIRHVVRSLLDNAVKFTDRGRVALLSRRSGGDRIVIRVEDTGPGIRVEDEGRLFVAFSQAEAGRRSSEGTGLGLAVCQGLARLMGGEIRVESTPGEGAAFELALSLPVPSSVRSTVPPAPATEPPVADTEGGALTAARLAARDPAWRDRLAAALAAGDDEDAFRIALAIREEDEPLARALHGAIRDFRFDRLLRLLEAAR